MINGYFLNGFWCGVGISLWGASFFIDSLWLGAIGIILFWGSAAVMCMKENS